MLFWRATTIEKCIPLSLVIDIIIEQGIAAISIDFPVGWTVAMLFYFIF